MQFNIGNSSGDFFYIIHAEQNVKNMGISQKITYQNIEDIIKEPQYRACIFMIIIYQYRQLNLLWQYNILYLIAVYVRP